MIRWWRSEAADQGRKRWVKRFDPRWWLINFPRPMMASVVTSGAETVVVDLEFQRRNDLAGLIWESEDRWSHPLCALATNRDYRGLRWHFHFRSTGPILALDAVNGPVLTIEGRDASGRPRTWYVRLWNYAVGNSDDAVIRLDFDALDGGFLLPAEADPVWPGDVDRLLISLVPIGHDGRDQPLASVVTARVELTNLLVDGSGATLAAGSPLVPPQPLRLCSAYDDQYNQTPERLLEQALMLGWRGPITHYLGMSHFMGIMPDGRGGYVVDVTRPICGPAAAWHRDFFRRSAQLGLAPIVSLSMELFAAYCPPDWAQRDFSGAMGLTGWQPPSALLSPCHASAQQWLATVVEAALAIAVDEGLAPAFQVGEPWWWVGPDQRPCLYDAATVSRWQSVAQGPPPVIADIRGAKSVDEQAYLSWCGQQLAAATRGMCTAAQRVATNVVTHLLFYTPQVLLDDRPDLARANMPSEWAYPAFDILQLEDYTFVTGGNLFAQAMARQIANERLAYPLARQHYLAGFVLAPADANSHWPRVADAASAAVARGIKEVFVWAWPQVARDGFTPFQINDESTEDKMAGFHDVRFPLQLGFGATGGPAFSTQVVMTASGAEQRNAEWADALLSFDAGIGVRSEADLDVLLNFFRARRGQAYGFRFLDPLDNSSAGISEDIAATDELIGVGDGQTTRFALQKHYGIGLEGEKQHRRITRPWAETVVVAVNGLAPPGGFLVADAGWIDLAQPPALGAPVTAGFRFDVPVRFAADRLEISLAGWRAGELPSVPLVEIRED